MLNKQDYKTSFFRINFKILERNKLGLLGKWENERKIRNIIAYLIFLISFGNSNNIIHTSLKNFISYLSFPIISQEQSSLKKKNRRKKKLKSYMESSSLESSSSFNFSCFFFISLSYFLNLSFIFSCILTKIK